MSDYTKVFDGAAKDAANATVLGADHDTEFSAISTAVNSKVDKVAGGTAGNLAELDSSGNLVDSGIDSANLDGLTGVVETRIAALEPAAAVTNHVRAGHMQLLDGSTTPDAYDWLANLTASAFETFGPTDSGATNIYDDLDVVPATANAIILVSEMEITVASAQGTGTLYGAVGGVTGAQSIGTAKQSIAAEANSGDKFKVFTQIIVPCDSNLVFQLAYTISGTGATMTGGNLYYKGFIEDLG